MAGRSTLCLGMQVATDSRPSGRWVRTGPIVVDRSMPCDLIISPVVELNQFQLEFGRLLVYWRCSRSTSMPSRESVAARFWKVVSQCCVFSVEVGMVLACCCFHKGPLENLTCFDQFGREDHYESTISYKTLMLSRKTLDQLRES